MTQTIGSIELRHTLGQGAFGKVVLGYDKKKQSNVAVKVIEKSLVREMNIQAYVEREIELMRKLKHDHVVRLLAVLDTSKAYHLVMELATGGEVFDRIVESKRFDEQTARKYFQQLVSAVHYCHQVHNIVHRDLKAENLLLDGNADLKVCDFGLSRYASAAAGKSDKLVLFTSLAGSTDYQAPEVIKEDGYMGFSCDIWSCGVILFFMLCGYLPFADRTEELTRERVLAVKYNKDNKYLPDSVKHLLSHMLTADPAQRYTIMEVIRHPWVMESLDVERLFPTVPKESFGISPIMTPTAKDVSGSFRRVESPEVPGSPVVNIREELHLAFQSCNVNHSGFLTRDEVRDVLVKLNDETPVADDEVTSFMSNFELDPEGRITEEQFIVGWGKVNSGTSSKYHVEKLVNIFHFNLERELLDELRKAFNEIDRNHFGVITPENILELNLGVEPSQVQEFFDTMDPAHKGKPRLNFEHFVETMTRSDLLRNHPLAVRLKRVNQMFEVSEMQSYRCFLAGFTVAGFREVIANKIKCESPVTIHTTISAGETEGYYYGSVPDATMAEKMRLQVGIMLLPAATGYTKVQAYRILGKTENFHLWFKSFRRMLRNEIQTCEEDTLVRGESELL
jgi:serine/threonine protein kinase